MNADDLKRDWTWHGRQRELTARRFPPPWSVEERNVYFVVRDYGWQPRFIPKDEPGQRLAAKSKVIRPVPMSAFHCKSGHRPELSAYDPYTA